MERLTYVDDDGTVLFIPDGYDIDNAQTIRQLADNQEYEYLEEIADRLANREQSCENFDKKSIEVDKLYLEKCDEVNKLKADAESFSEDYDLLGKGFTMVCEENEKLKSENLTADEMQEQGRLIELPNITKNKTLYWIWGNEIMPVQYKGISGGCVDKVNQFHITCKMVTKKPRTFQHNRRYFTYGKGDVRYFYADNIGKSIFLTKEDAEKKLAESVEE